LHSIQKFEKSIIYIKNIKISVANQKVKNMNRIIVLFQFLFFLSVGYGQSNNSSVRLKEQANHMRKFFLEKDYEAFSKYTHPTIIEMAGGRQQMIKAVKNQIQKMKAEGAEFLDLTIGEPSEIIRVENELQCTVPQTITLKIQDQKITKKTSLIAISTDSGENWYFIDAAPGLNQIKKAFPKLSNKLVILQE
jgi:hypothetical protein